MKEHLEADGRQISNAIIHIQDWKTKAKIVLKETIDHSQRTEVNVIDIGDRDLQNKPATKSLNTAIGWSTRRFNCSSKLEQFKETILWKLQMVILAI
mgnify:CR=1 FL=1